MVGFLRQSLLAKLFVLLVATVAIGFGTLVIVGVRIQARAVDRMNRDSAEAVARGLTSGVRNAMLSGNGLAVRQMLEEAKKGMQHVEVHVYAPDGTEVFGDKSPPPLDSELPVHVKDAVHLAKEIDALGGAHALPIKNENRCSRCHEKGTLRGVLTLGTKGARLAFDGDRKMAVLSDVTRAAFVQIMTARQTSSLDDYFDELPKQTKGLLSVAVYGIDKARAFGDEKLVVPDEVWNRAFVAGPAFTVDVEGKKLHVQPLANERRCQGCHGIKEKMRGALVVQYDPSTLGGEDALLRTCETSLQHVMLAGLGRLINGFLDSAASTGVLSTLTLHDAEGRLYHDAFGKPVPPKAVANALGTQNPQVEQSLANGRSQFIYVEPMLNEERCQRCHGGDLPVRGAIAVAIDRTEQLREQRKATTIGTALAAGTVFLIFLVLYFALHTTVLRPVLEIGNVADKVGEGKLDAKVDVRSVDEIGRLGGRLNDMVEGLRKKLELSKFVSNETVRTIEERGAVSRRGKRLRVTMLFSDIRGFTAFSETREPEEVVDMLNRYLHVQAEAVVRQGGDIDKFVGDELMARFMGDDADEKAVRCAIEMVDAVAKLNEEVKASAKAIQIGVGINAGEVVLGAMGAEHRMDFTVIGDAVNLAARLCSAAERGQVLISGTVRSSFSELEGIEMIALDPIQVKGKSEPIPIFAARRRA